MNPPLISVIIPVYNAEQFLSAALDSVLAQTYKNWELILIDDGSIDQSGAICDQYAVQHPVQVSVIHQCNQGVSVARNAGLRIAQGDFIFFIDADDVIAPDCLTQLWMRQEETGADMVCASVEWVDIDLQPISRNGKTLECCYNADSLHHYLNKEWVFFVFPWGKIYRKSLIDKYNLCFCDEMRFAEDTLFLHCYDCISTKVACVGRKLYFYRQYGASLSKRTGNVEWMECYIRKLECFRCFTNKYQIRTQFVDRSFSIWCYNILRGVIDKRFTYREMKRNIVMLNNNEDFREYISHSSEYSLAKLEHLYARIIAMHTPPGGCSLLFVMIHRIKKPLNFIRLMLRRRNSKV